MQAPKILLFAVASFTLAAIPALRAQTVPGNPTESVQGDAGSGTIAPDGTSSLDGVSNVTGLPPDTGAKQKATGSPLTFTSVSTGAVVSDGEDVTSIDGVNHDYFKLTIDPTLFNGTGKVITVTISWLNPVTDYDLYIHGGTEEGPVIGSSAGGAPGTQETVAIDPTKNLDTSGKPYTVYYLNVVYFTVYDNTVIPYTGTVVITNALSTTLGTYKHSGTITFSSNTPCKSPSASQQGEPASRIDAAGHYYISGIEGVPAGVDLWYFDLNPSSATYDPLMTTPQYRGMPDSLTNPPPGESTGTLPRFNSGGVGGGDVDVAVGFGNYTGALDVAPGENPVATPAPAPALAMSSLTAANVTTFRSLDLGKTFVKNDAGNAVGGIPVNDRQWMQFLGNNDVYLEYRNFAEGIAFIQESIDGGLTYNPASLVGTIPQTGYIDVDQNDGTVYVGANDGSVSVGKPTTVAGLSVFPAAGFTKYQATASTTPANIFFCTRVAQNDVGATEDKLSKAQKAKLLKSRKVGKLREHRKHLAVTYTHNTVYAVYSDGTNIFLVYSLDQAQTWSDPVQVNDPNDSLEKVNLLPWFAPGPMPGTVGVVWYGTDNTSNSDASKWRVFYAYGIDANTDAPVFDITQASDHSIHAANISLNGLSVTGESPNRNLIDYFQIQFDPLGAAVIGYTDDHNDFQGFTYVMRQLTGPSALTGNPLGVNARTAGASLASVAVTQPAQPGPNGEQVTDYAQDQSDGLVGGTPTNSPVDIETVKYQSQDVGGGPVILATMKVSQLSPIPVDSTWMMFFTANAPEVGNVVGSPGNKYSTGLSDRGDQFFVEAVTGASGATTYSWGSVIRNFDGSTTDTVQDTADSGDFNRAAGTISVRVSVSKLNTFLDMEKAAAVAAGTVDPNPARYTHLASGTVLCGLRGLAFEENTTGGDLVEDATRGGTEYTIP